MIICIRHNLSCPGNIIFYPYCSLIADLLESEELVVIDLNLAVSDPLNTQATVSSCCWSLL